MPAGEGTERETCSLLLTVLRKIARGEESLSFLNQFLEGRAFRKSRTLGVGLPWGSSLVLRDGMRSLNSLSLESFGVGVDSSLGAGIDSTLLCISSAESMVTILVLYTH